ncbi:GNAT family N-acetyltransferase [Catellatospora sp. KI3]|uniref:GNAT family N-acetyltransferase n=1 Tax=Catellatospora sp. KI3 TaxID=3041620 RepID=UPI002482D789|nr:GNAT family N-acetyltransferase [Catellatospora sp. KI3]MDI1461495.1 GNAT family N-acetyltransferase [Catellatospora sp. KI3]
MVERSVVAFRIEAAGLVSGWATTAAEVAAWCSRDRAPVPPEVVASWSGEPDVRAYLLLEGDEPVGYGELWLDDEEGEVELARLLIAPRRRGHGLGRELVRALTGLARRAHPTVFLRLVPGNDAALACYLGAGFVRVAAEQEREWNAIQPRPYLWLTFTA